MNHGESNGAGVRPATKEYTAWLNMHSRCGNPLVSSYAYYGGRGVRVTERWGVYTAFLEDVGRAPSADYSLDRIDGCGDYAPGNVRWATKQTQMRNRRGWGKLHKGVVARGARFRAYIYVAKTFVNLGTFGTLGEATDARLTAERAYFTESK